MSYKLVKSKLNSQDDVKICRSFYIYAQYIFLFIHQTRKENLNILNMSLNILSILLNIENKIESSHAELSLLTKTIKKTINNKIVN